MTGANEHHSGSRSRAAGRLPRGERVRPVVLPGAARGSGCVLEPEQAALHRARVHNILAALPPETLDNIGQWTGQPAGTCACRHGRPARCLDGPRAGGGRQQEQRNPGRTRGSLDLAGPLSPLREHETARCLLGRRADYVISAIKDNQETILEAGGDRLQRRFRTKPSSKGHGRIERRRSGRIERERRLKTGKRSIEAPLGTDRAGPEELLALVNHWHIALTSPSAGRMCVAPQSRNSIVRCSGRFRSMPPARRNPDRAQ